MNGQSLAPDPLPDISDALTWRAWSAGLDEAASRQVPIFLLVEPAWANSSQRLALIMGKDDSLRDLIETSFVPILVDPLSRPDIAAHMRWASIALTGTSGPPLLLLLTHEGLPFLSYCSMWPEGRDPYPSLSSLLRSTTETYAQRSGEFVSEGHSVQKQAAARSSSPFASMQAYWEATSASADFEHGGFLEEPKHPHPQMLWLLLDEVEKDRSGLGNYMLKTLKSIHHGGIHDQLGKGFHRCTRDNKWIVPHFEKILPLNAALVAVYARAARILDNDFAGVASQTAEFVLTALDAQVGALGSDTYYYTWTAQEILDALEPAVVQAIGFHFHITPNRSRHALYRAIEPETMAAYSFETVENLRKRINLGKKQLSFVRNQRRPPQLIQVKALSWTAESIRWLFEAATQELLLPIDELEKHLHSLTMNCFHDSMGYLREDSPKGQAAWLEDQVSLGAAFLAAYEVTAEREWLEKAQVMGRLILESYFDSETGQLLDCPHKDSAQYSQAVVDHFLPATIGTTIDLLFRLGNLMSDMQYQQSASAIARAYFAAASHGSYWAGSFWRAYFSAVVSG